MSNKLFKAIINKRLGKMDVVSEATTANGKMASESTGGTPLFDSGFKPIVWALLLSMGNFAVVQTAFGQVVADILPPKNQQAIILNAASGATQANITHQLQVVCQQSLGLEQ